MFCKNCGAQLNEKADFCPQCGLKIGDLHTHKKIIIPKRNGLISVVVVILAIIITLTFVKTNSVNSSPEKVAAATIKSEYEIDIKTMMKCIPNFTIREIAVDEGLSENASRSDVIKKVKEDYRYETSQKVEIVSSQLMEEYDINDYTIFRELYDYMTDKEYDLITKVAKVNVEFIVDGEENSIQLTCIKMKNKWYFLRNS